MNLKLLQKAIVFSAAAFCLIAMLFPALAVESVKASSDAAFAKDVVKADKPVLVDFYADWCQPCRKLSPTIEAMAKKYAGKIDFYKINVDQSPKISEEYKVNAIPAIKIFKGGKVISESVGSVSEASIDARLENALK